MVKGNMLIDERQQISVNLVILKTHGKRFEICVEPEKVVEYKEGKNVSVSEVMQADEIYKDMKKGEIASPNELSEIFGTSNPEEVAKIMIDKGEIQFTQKYRQKLYDIKSKQIINAIHRCAVNPKTGLPHPIARIENAIEEAKIKIDFVKSAEKQVKEIIPLLQPIIPISVEEFTFSIHVPSNYVGTVLKVLKGSAKLLRENWGSDGSGFFTFKIPSGQSQDLIDKLNSLTHASITLEKITNGKF